MLLSSGLGQRLGDLKMSAKEWLRDREQALENEYFRRRDRELIERLREQGRQERERQALEGELGIHDEAFLSRLQAAGFGPSNLALLHLVPLVEVGWADGELEPRERELILALAESRGITPGSEAHDQLDGWLAMHPGQEFFETTFSAIRMSLDAQDAPTRKHTTDDLVAWCTRIAEATGGILGMMPISHDERECLRHIAAKLDRRPDDGDDDGTDTSTREVP